MATSPLNDRRRVPRDTVRGEPARMKLVRIIEGTYREMPGLDLTITQAARLFGLRESTCRLVFEDLSRAGSLQQSEDGRYLAGSGIKGSRR
jgi:hypothetical protein